MVFVYKQLNVKIVQLDTKTVLFQTIQFSRSTWDQWHGRSTLYYPKLQFIGTSASDSLVSYPGHFWGGSYLSEQKQSVYSIAPVD